MRKVFYLLLLTASSVMTQVYSQNASDVQNRYAATQKKYTFTIQPLQLFNNALRFDYEVRLGNGPGWLQFGPAVYLSANNDNTDYYYDGKYYQQHGNFHFREPYSEMTGVGLDVNYKWFMDSRRSLYVATGVTFTHFNFKYRGRGWLDYVEDGLQYLEYGAINYQHQRINRPGVNVLFGYRIPSRHAFIVDMFWGVAARYSYSDEDKPSFNENMFSYGYSGYVFQMGVKFGIGK
jgi:hypothetical protein